MRCANAIERELVPRLLQSAAQSPSKYNVAAAAYSRKGNLLGISFNTYRCVDSIRDRKGTSRHAEMRLIAKFGRAIHTIYIVRRGSNNARLPICACSVCAKVARKLNIKIVALG